MSSILDYASESNPTLEHRYEKTLAFLSAAVPAPARVLDIGSVNRLSGRMIERGYNVVNTEGDLDTGSGIGANQHFDIMTAFEILEHLINPMGVLTGVRADHLVATVPLRLWFANSYRSEDDRWNSHFHEFEDWQFEWLLDRCGWSIQSTEKWTSPIRRIGIRPLIRRYTPRYLAVHAVRK